jgi:hypothetical protein
MSSTTELLRSRLSDELEELGTIPDLAPAAARAGGRILRRRRLAVGSALGVAALGGGVLTLGQGGTDPGSPAAIDPSGTVTPAADPMADGTVTTEEWHETVRGTLEALLPARYGTVATAPAERNRAQQFTTSGGDPRLQLRVSVNGSVGSDARTSSCADLNRARSLLTCEEAQLPDGWFAVSTTELAPATGDGGAAAYGTVLEFMNDGVYFELYADELGWDGLEPNQPAGLAAQELIDLASTAEFLAMVRVGVEWQLDQPEPAGSIYEATDPVWPTP